MEPAAEGAGIDPGGVLRCPPSVYAGLGPAEKVCGHLVDCVIDHDAREHVMGKMMVAKSYDGGLRD
eukprot:4486260-Heterocapsa_arctica.AAC.1